MHPSNKKHGRDPLIAGVTGPRAANFVAARQRLKTGEGKFAPDAALNGVHLDTTTTDGRANLPVCPNLTASQRSNAGGTLGIRMPEHRSARSGGRLGGAAAPPYLGGVKLRPFERTRKKRLDKTSRGIIMMISNDLLQIY